MKNNIRFSLFVIFILHATSTYANTPVSYSPYSDMTINTYWDSQYQDQEPADLTTISNVSGVKSYHLAFITDAGKCVPAWGAQSSYAVNNAWGKHMTDKLLAAGIEFSVSFGGASGNDISQACTDQQLLAAYEQVISTYQPKGLDFDIENGTANISKIMTALKKVQNNHPTLRLSMTLPVMPEGLTWTGEDIVKQAQAAGLSFTVNIMAMDYGSSYTGDMGDYAIQAATNVSAFLKTLYPIKTAADIWKMIEVTPMIGVNDVNVEQFTLEDTDQLRNFALQNQLGRLAMWSIARDNPCSSTWASPTCSGNNLQTKPYEFSMHFLNQS